MPSPEREQSADHKELFDSVLSRLSSRAFNAIVASGVRDLAGYLGLEVATLRARRGVGNRTISEIEESQTRLRRHLSKGKRGSTRPASHGQQRVPEHRRHEKAESATLIGGPVSGDAKDIIWQRLLSDCGARTRTTLLRLNVDSVDRLLSTPIGSIRECRGAGAKVEQEVLALREQARTLLETGVEPCRWSILWQTLPSLGRPESEGPVQSLGDEAGRTLSTLSLSSSAWRRLRALAIFPEDPLSVLYSLSASYWLSAGLEEADLEILLEASGITAADGPQEASVESVIPAEEVAAFSGVGIDVPGVPDRLRESLRGEGMSSWEDITSLSERSLLARYGVTARALRIIAILWQLRAALRIIRQQLPPGLPRSAYTSFGDLLNAFTKLAARDEREDTILRGRLGLVDGRKLTLHDLGDELGITRERVRQLEKKRVAVLKQSTGRLWQMWHVVIRALARAGGAYLDSEMAEAVARAFGWEDLPNPRVLMALIRLCPDSRVSLRADRAVLPACECLSCELTPKRLGSAVSLHDGVLPIREAQTQLAKECAEDCPQGRRELPAPSAGFVHSIAEKTDHLRCHDGVIYTRGQWALRRGPASGAIDALMLEHARPMHYKEVASLLREYRPRGRGASLGSIHNRLAGPEYLLWGRGEYIHRAHVVLPEALLSRVTRWLRGKLRPGVPFYDMTGAFSRFQLECEESGIPNTYALYSCLRAYSPEKLGCPRYPYVVGSNTTQRETLPVVLAEYALDAGGPVSLRDMVTHAEKVLGVPEERVHLRLGSIPSLIRVGRGQYLHLDLLDVSSAQLKPLTSELLALLEANTHISVRRLFEARRVTCQTLGIRTPTMLYYVLRHSRPAGVGFPRYPQISTLSSETGQKRRDTADEVLAYLRNKKGPCSIDELEEQFVERRRYGMGTVYGVIDGPEVVRHSRGAVVHLDTLAWNRT
ncbi:MAG: hypothetical protein JXA57_10925, partial [Armatimonadetes bacterium]|nr:hypothetical protein [Armatimonadota bacterium]